MTRIVLLALFVVVASCSSIQVSSDYDKTANFASYKSYTYTEEALNLPVDDLNRRRIIDALDAELAAKGLTKSSSGDLLVDIKITAEKKQQATATTTGPGYYGAGYAYRWGGGFSTTNINVETYVEGTMFVDLIDASKKQLIWQGRGMRTLDPDATAEQREQRIKDAVKAIMAKYPPAVRK